MTLQEWGAIGEFVGGVAVIATLIYLAVQTRQAKSAALGQAPQWISDGYKHWVSAPRQDPEFAELCIRAMHNWSGLSPVEQFRTHSWWGEKIVHLDAILTLHEQGVIDDKRKRAWVDDSLGLILTPGGSEWWSEVNAVFTPNVRDELESRLEEPSTLPAGFTTTLSWFRDQPVEGASG
jgi:hypothetical protein